MKLLPFFTLLGLLSVAVTPAWSQPQAKPRVAFVANNPAEFWRIAEAGTKAAAQKFAVDVLVRKPVNATAAEQKEILDALLTSDVTAMSIAVIDRQNQGPFLDKVAAQVPLITFDNDAPQTKRLCYVGTDNYQSGRAAGQLVKEALPTGGTVALFVGQNESLNAQQRRQGILDELAGTKDAKGPQLGKYRLQGVGQELAPFIDEVDERRAKEQADKVLVQLRDEKHVCLVGLWAYNPPALYAAVKAAGKAGQVQIVGFDEDDNTLLGIKAGHIHGSIVQQPFEYGYQSVRLLAGLVRGDRSVLPKDGVLWIPHRVVTRANVEAFQQELQRQREN